MAAKNIRSIFDSIDTKKNNGANDKIDTIANVIIKRECVKYHFSRAVAVLSSCFGVPMNMLKLYIPNVDVNSKKSTAGMGFAPIR